MNKALLKASILNLSRKIAWTNRRRRAWKKVLLDLKDQRRLLRKKLRKL